MTPRRRRRRGHRVRAARPRRRRLPGRHQVAHRARRAEADVKYVCCNADEGDSGTFADRMLMEGDPFTLIEGMLIAAYAVGADAGLRLPALRVPRRDRDARTPRSRSLYAHGWLGDDVLGSGLAFDLDVRVGAGAYICGEETVDAREPRGQARRGARQAAAPRDRRACSASRPWSTTC